MSDPIYPPEAYIMAHDLVRHIGQNLQIQFQIEGLGWDRETMQKHINTRAALIKVQQLLLDEGERSAGVKGNHP